MMKIRTQQADITSKTPYLEFYQSLDARALFINNATARQAITIFTNRGIKTMDKHFVNNNSLPGFLGEYLHVNVLR